MGQLGQGGTTKIARQQIFPDTSLFIAVTRDMGRPWDDSGTTWDDLDSCESSESISHTGSKSFAQATSASVHSTLCMGRGDRWTTQIARQQIFSQALHRSSRRDSRRLTTVRRLANRQNSRTTRSHGPAKSDHYSRQPSPNLSHFPPAASRI
jgi:hypothetical protein